MMLGKLSVPGRPTNLNNSKARSTALAAGAGRGYKAFFLLSIISLFFLFQSDID